MDKILLQYYSQYLIILVPVFWNIIKISIDYNHKVLQNNYLLF